MHPVINKAFVKKTIGAESKSQSWVTFKILERGSLRLGNMVHKK